MLPNFSGKEKILLKDQKAGGKIRISVLSLLPQVTFPAPLQSQLPPGRTPTTTLIPA
jgi:hypothetical protein